MGFTTKEWKGCFEAISRRFGNECEVENQRWRKDVKVEVGYVGVVAAS